MKKTALITGASKGLGLALARALAVRGWALIINARGVAALETARAELAHYTNVKALAGDVTDAAHRQQLAALVTNGLDLVVNNAGALGPSPQPVLVDYPLEQLAVVYSVNVLAPLGILQLVFNKLNSNAVVINITSDAAVEAYAGWGGYGSSKAALEQLTAIFSAENPHLRTYWIDPGDMRTDMHQAAFPNEDISDRDLPEASIPGIVDLILGNSPSGRYQAKTK
ncbi:MAG: SDR family oxidoreductase [Candidatus Promineifilaceae bacterium]